MLTQDASAVLPIVGLDNEPIRTGQLRNGAAYTLVCGPDDYRLLSGSNRHARRAAKAAPLRDRQHSDLTTARAKVKPKGDRMRLNSGD